MLGPAPSIAASNRNPSFVEQQKPHPNSSGFLLISFRFRNSCFSPSCQSTALRKTSPNGISYTSASNVLAFSFPALERLSGRGKCACVQVQKLRCRYPQLWPCTPNPKGSPAKLRPSRVIWPEKSASECGVRENPIQPLLLSVTRNVERQWISHESACPSTYKVPRQEFSPIPLLPIWRWNGFCLRALRSSPSRGNP